MFPACCRFNCVLSLSLPASKGQIGLSRAFVRNSRVFSRRPVKVLTDDGSDYLKTMVPQVDRSEYKVKKIVDPKMDEAGDRKQSGPKGKPVERAEGKEIRRKSGNDLRRESSAAKEMVRVRGLPPYEVLGKDNNDFLKAMMAVNRKSKNKRTTKNLMVLEGRRLIVDAIESGVKLETIYFSTEDNLASFPDLTRLVEEKGVQLKKIFHKDIQLFSKVVTSPGLMGVFERPEEGHVSRQESFQKDNKMPVTLIADNIRLPGNLGALIRSAAATGIEKLICTKGCVDIWDPKVIRAGAGAHFRIPILSRVDWPEIFELIRSERPVEAYFAESCDDEDPRDAVMNPITTDCYTTTDAEVSPEKPIRSSNYSHVNYFEGQEGTGKGSIVLIMGGEAEGLSSDGREFASHLDATKVWIPLSLGVESLNTCVAASVILYEMRRQYLTPVLLKGLQNREGSQ